MSDNRKAAVGTLVPAQPGWVCWFYEYDPETGAHVRDFSIPLVGWRFEEDRIADGSSYWVTGWAPVMWLRSERWLATADDMIGYSVLLTVCPDGMAVSDADREEAGYAVAERIERAEKAEEAWLKLEAERAAQ